VDNSDDLVYDFGGIDTIVGSINTFIGDMQANLGEVDQTFGDLLQAGWHGAGADRFGDCCKQWHDGANDLADALQALARKVGDAAANMQAADQAAAARLP
jgi:WXG100 family type VII secretion target